MPHTTARLEVLSRTLVQPPPEPQQHLEGSIADLAKERAKAQTPLQQSVSF
jgi:hypothetical protein